MNCREFVSSNLFAITKALNGPILEAEDLSLLKYLLNVLEDLRMYTRNFTGTMKNQLCRRMHY